MGILEISVSFGYSSIKGDGWYEKRIYGVCEGIWKEYLNSMAREGGVGG